MDEYAEAEDIPPGLPLSAADLALAHDNVPRDLGALPFGTDGTITRSLWVVFVGEWGIWTRASLPSITGWTWATRMTSPSCVSW